MGISWTTEKTYDVVIIGAGPAGLECALQLKDTPLSVLILEKNAVIGPKACAGGLSGLARVDPPEDKTRRFSRELYFFRGRKYEIPLHRPTRTVDRYDLGQHQLGKINGAGNITILKETFVRAIERRSIVSNRGIFGYRMLVGADGASSLVRRHLGLKSKYTVGIYYDVPEMTEEFAVLLDPKLKAGYIWEFPHRQCTNVGIYFRPEQLTASTARRMLCEYLDARKFSYAQAKLHSGPINYDFRGVLFGSTYLVGDAAGLGLKNSGEGIPYALTSGREVARKILDPNYDMPELNELLKIKRKEESRLKIFDRLTLLRGLFLKIYIKTKQKGWY